MYRTTDNMSGQNLDKIVALQSEIAQLESLRVQKQTELSHAIALLPENSNLLFFFGDGCSFTKRAEAPVNCLEVALGKRLTRLETWHNKDNQEKYAQSGGEQNCGGVPYFYNKLSKAVLCGVSDCDAMKKWAKGAE